MSLPNDELSVNESDDQLLTNNDDNNDDDDNTKTNTFLSDEENAYIDNIVKCCEDETDFDIFQLMAIDTDTESGINLKSKAFYLFDAIKAILCGATQICGIIIILVDFVEIGLLEKGSWCPTVNYSHDGEEEIVYDLNLKLLSFLFSSFIAYVSIDHLNSVEKGMYRNMAYADPLPWISAVWLRIGFSVNIFVSIVAVYGSFLVVLFSDNSLDMVLNSVALFFIVELDNMLVKKKDYKEIYQTIEIYRNNADHQSKIGFDAPGCCKVCCNRIVSLFGWIYTLPFQILRYVSILVCFIIPFVVAYCY